MKKKEQNSKKNFEKNPINPEEDSQAKEEIDLISLIEKLKNQLKKEGDLAEDRLNQLKYLQAEFNTYRIRFEEEKKRIIEISEANLTKELLVILDDFERSLNTIEDKEKKEGLKMVWKNFLDILKKRGLEEINSFGKDFDPTYHEAILREESKERENIVLEELQKGYLFKGRVLRTSKVRVSYKKV